MHRVGIQPFSVFMLCLFMLFLCLWGAQKSYAEDVYFLENIEILLTEHNTPEKERAKAIQKATEKGFRQLLQRLTAQTAWHQHPEIIKKADKRRILDQFNVIHEERRPYKGVFNLQFNKEYIHNLLVSLSVPFSEVKAGTVLLLPLLELGERQLLWEETNPWRQKLAQATENAGLVKFILPIGDAHEMALLTPEMVAFGAEDMMVQIAENYNAKAVVVARFQMGLSVKGEREALLDLVWYGAHDVQPQYLQLPLQSEDGLDGAMQQVATKAVHAVEEAWRQLYILEFDSPGQALITYGSPSLKGVEALMAQLKAIPIVENAFLRVISQQKAVVQVDFFGPKEKFKKLAEKASIKLLAWGEHWALDLGSTHDNVRAYGLDTRLTPQEEIF